MVEEAEKDHYEQMRDENYRLIDSFKLEKERVADDIRSVSLLLSNKTDDFGVEASFEGYDSYEGEDLLHYTATSKFQKENMDLLYEQDIRNYPDGKLFFINNIFLVFKIYGENHEKYQNIKDKFEKDYSKTDASNKSDILTERPGAMRAWLSKWDPDFNVTFKGQGSSNEHHN